MSRPPEIPWDRIRDVLSCHPGGLPTPEIAALAAPVPGKGNAALLCHMMLRRHEGLGHVRRAGRVALGGQTVIWQLPPRRGELAQRLAREVRAYSLESRKLGLLRRRLAALARIEEALEELERVERELEALDDGGGL